MENVTGHEQSSQQALAVELLQLYPRQLTVAMALEAAEKIIEDATNG
ncbi:hypothetical protein N9B27_01410 [Akkermansiaceae bacterium]|nr:hypothetical protein [Akkermansiaceae bacterium]MDA7883071.1 hypothetical protein [Akkermansiaceae bacterium]MDA7928238.1 hypothetical protein [Akkermansiaceae bacterium]